MRNGLALLAIGLLIFAYIGSQRLHFATVNTDAQKLSEIKPVSDNVKILQRAFTKDWKGSKIEIAKKNLESPGQVTTFKPALTSAKKDEKKDKEKKKKKVAKKIKRKGLDVQIVNNKQRPQSGFSGTGGILPESPATPVFIPPTQTKTDTPQTVQEWMERLTNPVNKDNLDKLILSFQSGLIAGDLFYTVVDELLKSDDSQIQDMGLIALGSTPSGESFGRIVNFIEAQGESKIAATAREVVLNYKKLELIAVLNQQLYSVDPAIQFQAALLIRDSALDLLKDRPQTDPNTPPTTPPTNPARGISSRDLRIFSQPMASMQQLLASGQTQHQAIFQEAIQVLERLLKS